MITIEIDEFGAGTDLGPIIIYQDGYQVADLEGYLDDKIAINVGGVTRYLIDTTIDDGRIISHEFGRGFDGELFAAEFIITEERI